MSYKILKKNSLNPTVMLMDIQAPLIAKKALAGQFIILRIDEFGERIPLTIADSNSEQGIITIIFQIVGYTTQRLSALNEGDSLLDVAGPLGNATPIPENAKRVCIIGGGVGCAIAYPQALSLHKHNITNDVIIGFRNKDLVILEKEFGQACENLIVCTDDGSYGIKGFVTNALESNITSGINYDLIIAIGPVPMMKFVTIIAQKYNIPVIVSLNPIMIDGTGMCGCCRCTVGGVTKYACVDGPDFDGSLVDFDELIQRNNTYKTQEAHSCRLGGALNG
ncbi:MAG: sulfide/dihydroorotate dehydrogenase-like FAD/NAD-binding protein [Oscillospiraceae bacterium]|jgi:ferredoxin--NADP+ reductase|nr:sulfide/dihydroorotate dehydrogenase-like FAD/NAD-binding protein [Oscillospiraceae bacterium]